MLTLYPFIMMNALMIRNGNIYSPGPKGKNDVHIIESRIHEVKIMKNFLMDGYVHYREINAEDCIVIPAFVNPEDCSGLNDHIVNEFMMNEDEDGLDIVFDLIDIFHVCPDKVFPRSVNKNPKLLRKAAELTKRKVTVDMDVNLDNIAGSLYDFFLHGGDPDFLTLSNMNHEKMREILWELNWSLEKLLPLATINTTRLFHIEEKGRIEKNSEASLLLIEKDTLDLREIIMKGRSVLNNNDPPLHGLNQDSISTNF